MQSNLPTGLPAELLETDAEVSPSRRPSFTRSFTIWCQTYTKLRIYNIIYVRQTLRVRKYLRKYINALGFKLGFKPQRI